MDKEEKDKLIQKLIAEKWELYDFGKSGLYLKNRKQKLYNVILELQKLGVKTLCNRENHFMTKYDRDVISLIKDKKLVLERTGAFTFGSIRLSHLKAV